MTDREHDLYDEYVKRIKKQPISDGLVYIQDNGMALQQAKEVCRKELYELIPLFEVVPAVTSDEVAF